LTENPPYVNNYGQLQTIFDAIKVAKTPPKFTQDFIYSVLGLKTKAYRSMLPFFKRLGFTDQGSVPTENYKQYRGTNDKIVMANCIRNAYPTIFQSNEFAYKLNKSELTRTVKTATGLSEDDQILKSIVNSFLELCKLADFEGEKIEEEEEEEEDIKEKVESYSKLGISYNINLNLPPTTEIEVFNAIFKSLKENLLRE